MQGDLREAVDESEDNGAECRKGVTPAVCRSRDGSGVFKGNYSQIAGTHYGAQSIPGAWRQLLAMSAEITSRADQLHDHAALTVGVPNGDPEPSC